MNRRSGGGLFFSNIGKLTPEFVTCRKISLRKRGHEIIFCLLSIFFFHYEAQMEYKQVAFLCTQF